MSLAPIVNLYLLGFVRLFGEVLNIAAFLLLLWVMLYKLLGNSIPLC